MRLRPLAQLALLRLAHDHLADHPKATLDDALRLAADDFGADGPPNLRRLLADLAPSQLALAGEAASDEVVALIAPDVVRGAVA